MAVENVCLTTGKLLNSWEQLLVFLQGRLSHETFANWFKGTAYLAVDGETLLVSVPDRETRALLETEYSEMIRSAIRELGLPVRQVSYETASPHSHSTVNPVRADAEGD